MAGYKSANTHLHLMEAFTELYETSRDARVRVPPEEALRLNQNKPILPNPAAPAFTDRLDWSEVTDPASAGAVLWAQRQTLTGRSAPSKCWAASPPGRIFCWTTPSSRI